MTDAIVVLRKLTVLRDHLERVRRRRAETLERFVADLDLQDATAMSLLVAIQKAIDIAMHIAADEGWGIPHSYADGFEVLADHQLFDRGLARELAAAAGLRNRIAHGYVAVDVQRLYGEIPIGLATLERFTVAIAAYLGPVEP